MSAWLKRSWKAVLGILGAVLAVVLAVLTFGWVRTGGQRDQARDEAAIAKASAEVRRLEALRGEVRARVGEEDEAIARLDTQIRAQKQKVVAAAGEGEDMDDEELEAALKRVLGA